MPDERIIKLSPEVPEKIEIDDAGKLCQYVVNQSHISSPEIDNRTLAWISTENHSPKWHLP
jgi:hypothetical protein